MLIIFESPEPASGFQREGVQSFLAESQLAFDRLTLYAPGAALHGAQVGGKLLMLPSEKGAVVTSPLTFPINGFPGEKIVIELRAVELSAPAPYAMIRPVKVKQRFDPPPRKPRGVRLVFDE